MVKVQIIEQGSITSTPGFKAAGVACGLKPTGALDLALAAAAGPCAAAAMFPTNAFKAAPVLYDMRVLKENPAGLRAVVINSGCANACTGERGLRDAETSAACVGEALGVLANSVMVMSTGVIGQPLPMDKIEAGIAAAAPRLSGEVAAGHDAARAIMTTDTRPKEVAARIEAAGGVFTVAGMAKGAGMIHPNMATMLCLVTSDARVTPELAQRALREVVADTLNSITVDGDTSTNDTVLFMANGQAAMPLIAEADSEGYRALVEGLGVVLGELAKGIVRDGEGATRFIEIVVRGARTRAEAKQVAMSVAKSPLVKTAIYGHDANWGRIVCAVGYSGVEIAPERVGVWLGDLELVRQGAPYDVREERASEILAQSDIPITIDLGAGAASATVWTCDFSHAYVDINAHYRT